MTRVATPLDPDVAPDPEGKRLGRKAAIPAEPALAPLEAKGEERRGVGRNVERRREDEANGVWKGR